MGSCKSDMARITLLLCLLSLCRTAVSASIAQDKEVSPRSKSDYAGLVEENIEVTKAVTKVDTKKSDDNHMGPLGYAIPQEDRDEGSWWLSRMIPTFELPSILKPIQIGPFSLPKLPFYTISLV